MLWRRLDTPGHDACRLVPRDGGWRIEGAAVFASDGAPGQLVYRVECDRAWRTERGTVVGSVGEDSVDLSIVRETDRGWIFNGTAVPGLTHAVDLDLGFTPATNLLPIRRLALEVGQGADAPAAWLDVSARMLGLLPQRYERRGERTYWYEAPTVDYQALLDVMPVGFIRRYPGLWEADG